MISAKIRRFQNGAGHSISCPAISRYLQGFGGQTGRSPLVNEHPGATHWVYTGRYMAQPIKLAFLGLSLDETAKFLGVPPARAREIEALVESGLNGSQDSLKRARPATQARKRAAKRGMKRAGATKAR
jgi:hypothetical protein